MTESLFRPEVLQARRISWLGPISLAQPIRLWALTAFAVATAVIVALFLVLGTYTHRTHVQGQLVPVQGIATVLAPATGVISRLDIAEGGRVEAGQTIAVIAIPRATVSDGDTLAALEARLRRRSESLHATRQAEQQLLDAKGFGLATQLTKARTELTQIKSEIDVRQQLVTLAENQLEVFRRLQGESFVSDLQIQQQQAVVLEKLGEVQTLQRQANSIHRQITQIQQAVHEIPGQRQASEANFQRELALLEQEQLETLARGELAITAPVSGVIATLLFKPGQAVHTSQSLMSLLPGDGILEAELLVPSRAIGFIEPGDSVLLRYQAYPYQKFGHHQGTLTRISRSALSMGQVGTSIDNTQRGETFYRVTVALAQQSVMAYGQLEPLKPGMLLDADVLGERRKLIEWVLEPLYSLRGRVGSG